MSILRWNPLVSDWVMFAAHRQNRPQMPKDWCPFCPGSGTVPDHYDVLRYDNDFPTLSVVPAEPEQGDAFFKVAPAYGKCEVILYSPDHDASLYEQSVAHVTKLVRLWTERFDQLQQDERIKYIFIFENRGEAVGVTMPHPHGQIYGYPYIPKKVELELAESSKYFAMHGRCLICDLAAAEVRDSKRVLFENEDYLVFLPFFSEYPYGAYIVAKRHVQNLTHLTERETTNLARAIRESVGMFDALFSARFPYMMCMYQNPVHSGDIGRHHFHIKFFPPLRSAKQQKFNASSETGAGAHCNPTLPEEKAAELREAHDRFVKSDHLAEE